MNYFELMKRRLGGKEESVPGWLGSKTGVIPFAQAIGVKLPKMYFTDVPSKLSGHTFPSSFVIKPTYASTSIGVHLMEKVEPGLYRDIVTGSEMGIGTLIEEYSDLSLRYYDEKDKGVIQVEELLYSVDGSCPPKDIRFYMFQGECGFILMEDHIAGKASASYFNGDFSPMDDVADRFSVHPGAAHLEEIVRRSPPNNSEELLNVARRISIAVPSSFCRVDLYDTSRGVVLGEITFYPGTFYYKNRKLMSDNEAYRLGELWCDAERKLHGSINSVPLV